jgi:predicted glycoside hydrolase/deacetylase ChbG (UPF0249 family)
MYRDLPSARSREDRPSMPEATALRSTTESGSRFADGARPRATPTVARPQLVVTGDDLGFRTDWDARVADAYERGFLTSTSIVANGPTYRTAVRWLRDSGGDCGVHLNLVHGEPLSPRTEVHSLVDARGCFPGTIGRFLLRYEGRVVRIREVALEWERQLQRAFDDGLVPTHLNAHYHLHALPGLFRIAVDLARRFDIGWVRVPDEPAWRAPGGAVGRARAAALWLLARRNRKVDRGLGVGLMPCRGIAAGGALGLSAWRTLLDDACRTPRDGNAIEVMCHPGQSAKEDAALSSPQLVSDIRERVVLRSFRELAPLR